MSKKTLAPQSDSVLNHTEIPKVSVASPQRGKSIRKTNQAKGGMDPSMGTRVSRRGIQERMGAHRRIQVALPGPSLPEARATQANGKVMPSVMGQKNNFFGAQGEAYSR